MSDPYAKAKAADFLNHVDSMSDALDDAAAYCDLAAKASSEARAASDYESAQEAMRFVLRKLQMFVPTTGGDQ